jgi:hypothetical protein
MRNLLLQVLPAAVDSVWSANLVSSLLSAASIIGFFAWLGKRLLDQMERRFVANEDKLNKALVKVAEIEKNYIHRFEEVNMALKESSFNIIERVTIKLDDINREKYEHRVKMTESNARLEQKVEQLANFVRENTNPRGNGDR